MAFKLPVEIVEHDARLDGAARALDVEIENAREIFGAIDDQRLADGLPRLRGAAAARQDGYAFRAGNAYRPFGFLYRARRDYAHRLDLIMRSVSRITTAGEAVEPDFAGQIGLKPPFQAGHHHCHSVNPVCAR